MPFVPDQQQQAQPTGRFVPDPPKQPGYASRVGSAIGDYARAAVRKPWQIPRALGETALSAASGMVAAPINDFWNSAMEAGRFPTKDIVPTYQPRTELGQASVRAGAEMMSPVTAGVDYMTSVNDPDPGVRSTGRAIRGALGVLPLVGSRALPKDAPRPAASPRAVPKTAAELRTEANAAYARADAAGKGEIVRQESLGDFTARTERSLVDQAIDAELDPMTVKAMNMLMEESTRPGIAGHSPQGLEILRRKLLKAEGQAHRSGNAGDARQVSQIIDDFDDFANNLVEGKDIIGTNAGATAESIAARTQARELWARMKRTQTIETLVERARDSAPALSQSGFENALRLEFKSLARNERRMRQFSPEERAAIQKVSRGGVAQWAARRVASIAPRGPVSATAATVIGGGGAGTAALLGVGEAGALAARIMRLNDVEAARALISNPRGTAAQPQRPAVGNPTAPAVRASTAIPPALASEVVDRQRNALYRDDDRRRNALAR